jgi:hypothetical protein
LYRGFVRNKQQTTATTNNNKQQQTTTARYTTPRHAPALPLGHHLLLHVFLNPALRREVEELHPHDRDPPVVKEL